MSIMLHKSHPFREQRHILTKQRWCKKHFHKYVFQGERIFNNMYVQFH